MTPCRSYKIIGITGGIATGKSTVSSILEEKGYKVIDADKIARKVVEVGEEAYKELLDYFGSDIVYEDGQLNRKKLASIAFNDSQALEQLNRITHPRIFKEIYKEIESSSKSGDKLIFIDIPLLFEEIEEIKASGIEIDDIWLVYVDKETQISRLMKRDSIDRRKAIKKINLQMDMKYKLENTDKVLYNNGDLKNLEKRIEKLISLE